MWSLIFADEWLYHHFSLCARCSGPLVRCNVAQQVLASAMDARSSSCAHQPHRVRQERRNDVYDQNFKACTQQGCMHRELCPGPARSTPPVQPSSSRGTHTKAPAAKRQCRPSACSHHTRICMRCLSCARLARRDRCACHKGAGVCTHLFKKNGNLLCQHRTRHPETGSKRRCRLLQSAGGCPGTTLCGSLDCPSPRLPLRALSLPGLSEENRKPLIFCSLNHSFVGGRFLSLTQTL